MLATYSILLWVATVGVAIVGGRLAVVVAQGVARGERPWKRGFLLAGLGLVVVWGVTYGTVFRPKVVVDGPNAVLEQRLGVLDLQPVLIPLATVTPALDEQWDTRVSESRAESERRKAYFGGGATTTIP